jgi:hypothetical protein
MKITRVDILIDEGGGGDDNAHGINNKPALYTEEKQNHYITN